MQLFYFSHQEGWVRKNAKVLDSLWFDDFSFIKKLNILTFCKRGTIFVLSVWLQNLTKKDNFNERILYG